MRKIFITMLLGGMLVACNNKQITNQLFCISLQHETDV